MLEVIREVCVLSVLFSAAMSLAPEGSVRKMMNIACTVVLMSNLLAAIHDFDYKSYSLELAKYKDREKIFLEGSEQANERLNKAVIEQSYSTYILDKAKELNVDVDEIKVTAVWSTEGLWLPDTVQINCGYSQRLSEYIEVELGIRKQRQEWNG